MALPGPLAAWNLRQVIRWMLAHRYQPNQIVKIVEEELTRKDA